MNTLRVLLVDADCHESARVVTLLSGANHSVLGTGDLREAAEALELQKFDAVLLGASVPGTAVPAFAASIRDLEQRKFGRRIPLFSISPSIGQEQGWSPAQESPLDGYLAQQFGPDTLTSAIRCMEKDFSLQNLDQHARVFLPAEFQEQCGGEPELMAEIIDLFLIEQENQLRAMRDAVANGRYEQLSSVAHTLKGSLASLHAAESRRWAECLEAVAKGTDDTGCRDALLALEQALEELKPVIQSFRRQVLAQ